MGVITIKWLVKVIHRTREKVLVVWVGWAHSLNLSAFISGWKRAENRYFSSKMAAQGQWFGLNTILIDFISGSYIANDFSMNFDQFIPIPGPLDLHFGPQKGRKAVKSSIMAAQGQWFGLKMILIDSISCSYISNDFSMKYNKFSPLPGPLDLHFGSKMGRKLVKSSKWRLWSPPDRCFW